PALLLLGLALSFLPDTTCGFLLARSAVALLLGALLGFLACLGSGGFGSLAVSLLALLLLGFRALIERGLNRLSRPEDLGEVDVIHVGRAGRHRRDGDAAVIASGPGIG